MEIGGDDVALVISCQHREDVVRLRIVRPRFDDLRKRGLGLLHLGERRVQRADDEPRRVVVGIPAEVILGVLDGRSITTASHAYFEEKRQDVLRGRPLIEGRREVLLGARQVADRRERPAAFREVLLRMLGAQALQILLGLFCRRVRAAARSEREWKQQERER